MTPLKKYITILGIIFLTSIALVGSCQPSSVPQVPREAQEVISAAAETIRQDKITIDSRSERIRMYKDQLAAAQKALDLALENDSLQEEIKSNMQSEIDFLIEQIAINRNRAEKDFKKERRRKIFWKSMAGVTTLTSLYFWIF